MDWENIVDELQRQRFNGTLFLEYWWVSIASVQSLATLREWILP
jgi:hypothetical protein